LDSTNHNLQDTTRNAQEHKGRADWLMFGTNE